MTAGYPISGTGIVLPAHEIWFEASHAAGPGGQHVNKAATRVTLCFCPAASGALGEPARTRVARALASRIGRDGVLRLSADGARSQSGNKALAVRRFALLLGAALRPRARRIATVPTAASRQRRRRCKTATSARKRDRGTPADEGEEA